MEPHEGPKPTSGRPSSEAVMSRWRDLVRAELRRWIAEGRGDVVARQDLLRESLPSLAAEFPDAATPDQTLSRVLQELRDLGELEFVAPGIYRIFIEAPAESERRERILRGPPLPKGRSVVRNRPVRVRPYQPAFRSWVLPNFGHACAVCGLAPEWFLQAAHLRPIVAHPDLESDASAGVALCHNHHAAVDQGCIVIEKDLHLTLRRDLLSPMTDEARRVILAYEGKSLREPQRFPLNEDALPSVGARSPP